MSEEHPIISVSHLTRRFGKKVAVNNVSFRVNRGEIVGFLGPNGAGKTTTMRVLSCFLPPTGGEVAIDGCDVVRASLDVRRRIGYMPEHVPLYPEMRVNEYLRYRARLKGVALRRCRQRVETVKELCGLQQEGRKIIGQLSKGYRQRVGLADALIHEPELLILDEPTIGLDPNQIRQVRQLIIDLSRDHTILLSTHILPEVEMTCQRVLIIHEGSIIASDTPENLRNLMRGGTRVITELHAPPEEAFESLSALPLVQHVMTDKKAPWTRFELECSKDVDLRQNVFEMVVRRGWRLRELRLEKKSLEDVFVSLTHEKGTKSEP